MPLNRLWSPAYRRNPAPTGWPGTPDRQNSATGNGPIREGSNTHRTISVLRSAATLVGTAVLEDHHRAQSGVTPRASSPPRCSSRRWEPPRRLTARRLVPLPVPCGKRSGGRLRIQQAVLPGVNEPVPLQTDPLEHPVAPNTPAHPASNPIARTQKTQRVRPVGAIEISTRKETPRGSARDVPPGGASRAS
jgi:hypothetical protein